MSAIPKWIKCETCGKRATLGLPSNLLSQHVRDGAINQKTREIFRFVFGKAKAAKLRSVKDVDAAFRDVARRYPHLMPGYKRGETYDPKSESDMRRLGTPETISRDPFPRERIRDAGNLHAERRVM